jgi:invasion protein IalB
VGIVLASVFATIPGALGASPSYTLTGYVRQPGGAAVPAGVQVDLVSQATGTVYTTTTGPGGQFTFTSSGTSGALQPGYWGLRVPPQTNASFSGCSPCAALAVNQNPQYGFENATALTTPNYPTILGNVQVLSYTATLTGTVSLGGSAEPKASVRLLAPTYNNIALVTNTTSASGAFSLLAPLGTWVLQSTAPGPAPNYVNSTKVVIQNRTPTAVNPKIQPYLVSGNVLLSTGGPVPNSGNATLYDPTNGYIYSSATPPGGYYQLGTYPANFGSGSQSFDVFLSTVGYATTWYPLTVSSSSPATQNVVVPLVRPSQLGVYSTTLDFSAFNVLSGSGNLSVSTVARLGNDTALPNLPNATVGQLWTQLGLDFAHSVSFPSSSLGQVYAWANASGPFFPAVQAGTAINGTGFVGPTTPQTLSGWSSTCSGTCDASSAANLTLDWSNQYALNSSVAKNSSAYTLSFNFEHPTSAEAFNYTVVLPAGYVLKAGAAVPTDSRLVAAGTGGTWTSFTLVSLPDPTPAGIASFSIVKYAGLTAIVNASVSNFAFSSHNVLNSTRGNYTVAVGVGQNVTFTAQNSLYPAGTNGTKFAWVFGDGGTATVTTASTYHTFTTASGATPYTGTLTVTSSGGLTDSTTFHVWAASGTVTAVISSNATGNQTKSAGGHTYLWVNWGTTLYFNASASTATISPSTTVGGVLSVASFSLVSKGFKQSANYSVGQGAYFGSNYTVPFLGAGSYLTSGSVAGTAVPFKGWQYNLTLTVWSGTGQSASSTLVILVNDTEKPVPAFQILNANGKVVSGTGLIAGSNASALVQLNGGNASDPHNGSLVRYYWLITNAGNSAIHTGVNASAVKPYPRLWLAAQTKAYKVNLTVWDLNGNHAYTTQSLTVSVNSTTSPIMGAYNLTGPAKVTDGSSYTYWVNVTVGGGAKSVATNIVVTWYIGLTGSTSRTGIAGSPASVQFYNYTSPGVPNSSPFATGTVASLAFNKTVRAVITWTPVVNGNYVLYANITASNEFSGDYSAGTNVATMSITISPNPTTQLLEYVAIGVAVVVVLLLIILYYRRRGGRGAAAKTSSRAGLERGGKHPAEDEDEEDESS